MPFQIARIDVSEADRVLRRELRLFNLYRVLESGLLLLALFGPLSSMLDEPRHALLGRSLAIAYLFIAVLLFAFGRRADPRGVALAGIAADLFFGVLAMHAAPSIGTGIALLLLFNVGAAALLLPPRLGIGAAVLAIVGVVGEAVWTAGLG
ncbi:MAG TPA: PAS domain-containing sensor histidine kinase, partial [Lysobacter sp.]